MAGLFETIVDRILAIEAAMFWGGIATWLMLSALVGAVASGRGRSGFGFFLLALFISPLITVIVLLFMPDARGLRLAALEARLAALETHLGRTPAADPAAPASASGVDAYSSKVLMWVLIGVIVLIAILGGISQLGSSANATFTTISDSL